MTHDPDSADDADESERAEAAALAAALDGEASAQPPPDDALSAALLMRHGGDRGQLPPERAEEILRDVLREPSKPRGRGAKIVRLWPVGAVVLAAAAALLLMVRSSTPAPAPLVAASATAPTAPSLWIPQASASLLTAQSAILQQSLAADNAQPRSDDAAQRYDRELRAYRSELFRSLAVRYPRKLGVLEPALQHELRARRLR